MLVWDRHTDSVCGEIDILSYASVTNFAIKKCVISIENIYSYSSAGVIDEYGFSNDSNDTIAARRAVPSPVKH